MKIISLILLGAFLVPAVFAPSAKAAPLCSLESSSFSALKSNETAELVKNLEIRKGLLKKVVQCMKEEVDELRIQLDKTVAIDPSMRALRGYLFIALENANRRYEEDIEKIPNVGLHSSKEIAKNLREWRANTFIKDRERIYNFITWSDNESLIETAGKRLRESERGVQLLKIVEQSEIQDLYKEAQGHYRATQDFHAQARNTFINGLDPSSSMKLSLDALSRTYELFIKLGDSINSLLPQSRQF